MRVFGSSVSGSSSSVSSVAGTIPLGSASRPSGARRGPLSHPAILFLIAIGILFGGYALGYIPQIGSLLEAAVRSGEKTAVPALSPVFYGIAGLVAFLLLLALLRSIDMLLRGIRNASPLANRPVKSLAEFIEETAAINISVRVAREGYHLLQPHYPGLMCISLGDRLRSDLRLDEEEILLLDAKLLTRCDRRDCSADVAANASGLITISDLLLRVEAASPVHLERPSGLRDRATDNVGPAVPVQKPGIPPDPRNPTSAQRKAIHAAALHAIESRSLRIAQTSGLKRRNSDYEGPRRRATDNPSKTPAYDGPYRRVTDQMAAFSDPSSFEHKAEFDPARLSRQDPLFGPTQGRQSSAPGRRNDR